MKSWNWKKLIITLLRIAIGWHFLYEGVSKMIVGNWSAAGYLAKAHGPFAGFYHWMAASEVIMQIVDPLNIAGLILIGLGLFLGLAISLSSISGVVLLMLYYFAYPPFGGDIFGSAEGTLYIVNKNLIESLALLIFIFIKEKGYGIYAITCPLMQRFKKGDKTKVDAEEKAEMAHSRREVLKNLATIPALGIIGFGAFRESKQYGVDTLSGATIKTNTKSVGL